MKARGVSGLRPRRATGAAAALLAAGIAASLASGSGAADAPGPASSDPAPDIRDIRGPKFILPAWVVPALCAGGALLAVGLYGAWRWQRRRHRAHALLPYEIALKRLADNRALMRPASAGAFSTAVSDIVRTYIEKRFEITVTQRTTEEFLRDLLDSPNAALARHRGLLAQFLQQCDLAKFAGIALTLENLESLYQSACALINETARAVDPAGPVQSAKPGTERDSSDGRAAAHDSLPSA